MDEKKYKTWVLVNTDDVRMDYRVSNKKPVLPRHAKAEGYSWHEVIEGVVQ